jgi:hypothetical protein
LRIGNADISCNIYEVIVIRALHPYSGAVISWRHDAPPKTVF